MIDRILDAGISTTQTKSSDAHEGIISTPVQQDNGNAENNSTNVVYENWHSAGLSCHQSPIRLNSRPENEVIGATSEPSSVKVARWKPATSPKPQKAALIPCSENMTATLEPALVKAARPKPYPLSPRRLKLHIENKDSRINFESHLDKPVTPKPPTPKPRKKPHDAGEYIIHQIKVYAIMKLYVQLLYLNQLRVGKFHHTDEYTLNMPISHIQSLGIQQEHQILLTMLKYHQQIMVIPAHFLTRGIVGSQTVESS